MEDFLDLPRAERASGSVQLPGSKSISNRSLLLAALAHGVTSVRNLLEAEDTACMLEALAALGVRIERQSPGSYRVHGVGGAFPVRQSDLFLGNAGTALRPLTAVLALGGGHHRVRGLPRMHERPIADLVNALRSLGCEIRYTGTEGYPPMETAGARRDVGTRSVRVRGDASSQFLTALLIAAPLAGRPLEIAVEGTLISRPYVEMTLRLMRLFGVQVERDGWSRFSIGPDAGYASPGSVAVEGDASSASYFLAAGALGGGPVRVYGVGRDSIQGDVRFADFLGTLGARVTWGEDWIESSGRPPLPAFDTDFNDLPDAAMTAAILALRADGRCVVRNIGSWRVKETDRLAAMATELRKVGAVVEEGADFLAVSPPARLSEATIRTYDDHRMAMCFSLVPWAGAAVRLLDPGCVAKTFPDYFARRALLEAG